MGAHVAHAITMNNVMQCNSAIFCPEEKTAGMQQMDLMWTSGRVSFVIVVTLIGTRLRMKNIFMFLIQADKNCSKTCFFDLLF